MPVTKRTTKQIALDMLLIERLTIEGHGEHEIARRISAQRPYTLSRSQVHYDREKMIERWRSQALESRSRAVTRLLREIDYVRSRAWDMLERSAMDALKVRQERTGEEAGSLTREVVQRYGDPALLRIVLDCNQREAKLLGLERNDAALEAMTVRPVAEARVVAYLPEKAAIEVGRAEDGK